MAHINKKTTLVECKDGFWLYDEHIGMNLSMRAPSREAALTEALEYYQTRLGVVRANERRLLTSIAQFIKDLEGGVR